MNVAVHVMQTLWTVGLTPKRVSSDCSPAEERRKERSCQLVTRRRCCSRMQGARREFHGVHGLCASADFRYVRALFIVPRCATLFSLGSRVSDGMFHPGQTCLNPSVMAFSVHGPSWSHLFCRLPRKGTLSDQKRPCQSQGPPDRNGTSVNVPSSHVVQQ